MITMNSQRTKGNWGFGEQNQHSAIPSEVAESVQVWLRLRELSRLNLEDDELHGQRIDAESAARRELILVQSVTESGVIRPVRIGNHLFVAFAAGQEVDGPNGEPESILVIEL